jgi:hypothetical protein
MKATTADLHLSHRGPVKRADHKFTTHISTPADSALLTL